MAKSSFWGGQCFWPWVGNLSGPDLGNPFGPGWGIFLALIQFNWGILLAPDSLFDTETV